MIESVDIYKYVGMYVFERQYMHYVSQVRKIMTSYVILPMLITKYW